MIEEVWHRSSRCHRAWFDVERLTRDLIDAEALLETELEADASLPHPEREAPHGATTNGEAPHGAATNGEAPRGAAAGGDKNFRVMRTASGAVGDEEEALHLYDVDGDMEVYFLEDTGCGWRGTAEKAALLADLVREVTGDTTLRVEEVPHG